MSKIRMPEKMAKESDNLNKIIVYHGSSQIVESPEIRIARFHKDFYFGFYCTMIEQQARRWAMRYGEKGYVSIYEYCPKKDLKVLKFEKMTEQWLDFIAACRSGESHDYDIVEGPWRMIRSIIMYRDLLMVNIPGRLFGN